MFTIKNGNDKADFFVAGNARVTEGNYDDYNTWKISKLEDIKVGDNVLMQTHALVSDQNALDSFFVFWIFKRT